MPSTILAPPSTHRTPHTMPSVLTLPPWKVRCSSPSHFPSLPHADMALARRVITESGHGAVSIQRGACRIFALLTQREPTAEYTVRAGPIPGLGPIPTKPSSRLCPQPLSPARRCEKCVLCACHHMCFHCALGALASGLSYHRAATLGENSKQRHTSPPTTATNACPYSCHTLVRAAQGMALRRVRGVRRLDARLDLHLSHPSSAGRALA